MKLLKKLIVPLLLAGYYVPAYAAIDDIDLSTCSVFSEGDKKEGKKKDGEEPECE